MISIETVKKYCCEDISLIENYEEAVNDKNRIWSCHHRKETDEGLRVRDLKKSNMYYNVPAKDLIFLTNADHLALHNKKRKDLLHYNPYNVEVLKEKYKDLTLEQFLDKIAYMFN